MLEIDRVNHSFGEKNILSDVYLKCDSGEIVGLLGRNGSGKSTLLKIIFGSLKAYNQNILINGTYLEKPFLEENTISYLPQNGFLPPKNKVKNLINLYIENKEKRNKVLNDKKIKKELNKRVRELSGGTLKYLEILIMLNQPSKFILLDEPFSGISPIDIEVITSILNKHKKDKGIIITDHQYETVLNHSDRLYLLYNGICKVIKDNKELEFYNYLPEGRL